MIKTREQAETLGWSLLGLWCVSSIAYITWFYCTFGYGESANRASWYWQVICIPTFLTTAVLGLLTLGLVGLVLKGTVERWYQKLPSERDFHVREEKS